MAWWLGAALAMLVTGLTPCLLVTMRGASADRLAGLILAGPMATLVLLLLAAGYGRPAYIDVAFVLALLAHRRGRAGRRADGYRLIGR